MGILTIPSFSLICSMNAKKKLLLLIGLSMLLAFLASIIVRIR